MLPHFSVEILLFYSMYHLNMLQLIINVSLGSNSVFLLEEKSIN